jgi:hypothetical protein
MARYKFGFEPVVGTALETVERIALSNLASPSVQMAFVAGLATAIGSLGEITTTLANSNPYKVITNERIASLKELNSAASSPIGPAGSIEVTASPHRPGEARVVIHKPSGPKPV